MNKFWVGYFLGVATPVLLYLFRAKLAALTGISFPTKPPAPPPAGGG